MALEALLDAVKSYEKVEKLHSDFSDKPHDTPVYQPLIDIGRYTPEQVEILGIRPKDEADHSDMKRYGALKIARPQYQGNLIQHVQGDLETALAQYYGDHRAVLRNVLLSVDNKLYESLGEDTQKAHKKALEGNAILAAKDQGNYAFVDKIAEEKLKEQRAKREEAIQKAIDTGHQDIAYIAASFLKDDDASGILPIRNKLLAEAQMNFNKYIEMIDDKEDTVFRSLYDGADENAKKQLALMLGSGLSTVEKRKAEAKKKKKA